MTTVHTDAPAAEVVEPAPGGETTVSVRGHTRLSVLERMNQALLLVAGIVGTLISLRFLLLALGADMTAPFASFMLAVTHPLVEPFLGLFGESPTSGPSILELSSLFAIFIYTLAAYTVASVLRVLMAPNDPTGLAYRV